MTTIADAWLVPLCVVAGTALTVYACDVAHVLRVILRHHSLRVDPAKVAAYRERMEAAYAAYASGAPASPPAPDSFGHLTTDEEFEANLADFERELDARGYAPEAGMFGGRRTPYTRLLREGVEVAIAPRAVIMQVAHPFVAVGIAQHSNVVRDTPDRFNKTYRYMFAIAFGDRRRVVSTARILRKLHNRVHGHFPADARGGALPRGQAYAAAHTHALLWVGLALAESVMLGHAMLVGSWTPAELDSLARDAALGLMLFGVPRRLATGTYEDFRVAIEACWTSRIIGASAEAEFVLKHLLYPKKLYLRPAFALARFVTRCMMPPRLAAEFLGREPSLPEKLAASAVLGALRFLNRFVPGPLRYMPEYSEAMRRVGEPPWPWWGDPCARALECVARAQKDVVLGTLMPSRVEDARADPTRGEHLKPGVGADGVGAVTGWSSGGAGPWGTWEAAGPAAQGGEAAVARGAE